MSNANTPIIPKDGVLHILDGAGTPLDFTVLYDGGDLSFSGLNQGFSTRQIFMSRGVPYSVRDTELKPIEFTFTCDAVHILGDGTTATIYDVLMKKAPWASATSTLPTTRGDTYCLTFKFTAERSNLGATADNTVTLKYCFFEMDFAEGIPGKWTIKGTMIPYSTDYYTAT